MQSEIKTPKDLIYDLHLRLERTSIVDLMHKGFMDRPQLFNYFASIKVNNKQGKNNGMSV